jgi:hypothetical protein
MATPICIPEGFGVPIPTGPSSYAASGPPIWWDTTSGPLPSFNTSLEDPRWIGSAGFGYPELTSVATDRAIFRAVHATDSVGITATYLYLSWVVKVDPEVGNNVDSVLVGFFRQNMAGSPGVAFRITPTNQAAAKVAAAAQDVDVFTRSSTGVWQPVTPGTADPQWITDFLRVWVDPAQNPRYPWAVQMRVRIDGSGDLNQGIDLQNAFRMRFQVNATKPEGGITFYKWPRTAATILGSNFDDPGSANWDDFQLGGGPSCSKGISIEWGDVRTMNVPDDTEIKYNRQTLPSNTFRARPRNQTTADIPASRYPDPTIPNDTGELRLSARFRIANWGSTPTVGGLWADIPGGFDVRNVPITGVTDGVVLANGQGDMRFNWVVEDPFLQEFENGTRRRHQCVLVELSGPNLTFTKSSVFQNMAVVPASTMRRDADISIQGLAATSGTHRDVYLYVQTLNMPSTLRAPERPREPAEPDRPPPSGPDVVRAGENGGLEDGGGDGNDGDGNGGPVVPVGPPPPPWEQETRPVYIVHAWHDTGETFTDVNGVTRKVLEAQTSYGFYLEHQGPLFGWDHKLTGQGLVEIAPDYYKVAVPNDGSVTVATEITALETPTDLFSLLAWLLALLRALWRAITRFFRSIARAIRKLFGS